MEGPDAVGGRFSSAFKVSSGLQSFDGIDKPGGMRRGEVLKAPGYDGINGRIAVFRDLLTDIQK